MWCRSSCLIVVSWIRQPEMVVWHTCSILWSVSVHLVTSHATYIQFSHMRAHHAVGPLTRCNHYSHYPVNSWQGSRAIMSCDPSPFSAHLIPTWFNQFSKETLLKHQPDNVHMINETPNVDMGHKKWICDLLSQPYHKAWSPKPALNWHLSPSTSPSWCHKVCNIPSAYSRHTFFAKKRTLGEDFRTSHVSPFVASLAPMPSSMAESLDVFTATLSEWQEQC